jgi:tetratricopeptide (TPR) repeat protein
VFGVILLGMAACAPAAPTLPTVAPAAAPLAAYPVAVCHGPPTPTAVAAAKGAHQAATRFFERGAYDEAIRCWTDAYELDCTAHDLLLNIAKALDRKGDHAASLATLRAHRLRKRESPGADPKLARPKLEIAARPGAR